MITLSKSLNKKPGFLPTATIAGDSMHITCGSLLFRECMKYKLENHKGKKHTIYWNHTSPSSKGILVTCNLQLWGRRRLKKCTKVYNGKKSRSPTQVQISDARDNFSENK